MQIKSYSTSLFCSIQMSAYFRSGSPDKILPCFFFNTVNTQYTVSCMQMAHMKPDLYDVCFHIDVWMAVRSDPEFQVAWFLSTWQTSHTGADKWPILDTKFVSRSDVSGFPGLLCHHERPSGWLALLPREAAFIEMVGGCTPAWSPGKPWLLSRDPCLPMCKGYSAQLK